MYVCTVCMYVCMYVRKSSNLEFLKWNLLQTLKVNEFCNFCTIIV
jgi:hypothetical protein